MWSTGTVVTSVLSALPLLAHASPQPRPDPQESAAPPLEQFFIQTQVTEGNKDHDGLYLEAVPSGDGSLLVAFSKEKNEWPAYMYDNELRFRYEDPLPYHLYLAGSGPEKFWSPTSVHKDQHSHTGKFTFNEDGNLWFAEGRSEVPSESHPFAGWFVCDWSLNKPQLFYLNEHKPLERLLPTCAKVKLVKGESSE